MRPAAARLVCAGLAVIALPAAVRADPLPHIGTLTSTTTSVVMTPQGFLHFETSLAGQGTILGNITGAAQYDVNPLTGAFTGTLTKVSTAGTLYESMIGQFNATFTASVGQFTIVRGTGRFKNATGAGLFVGEVTSAVTVDVDYLGTLTFGTGGR